MVKPLSTSEVARLLGISRQRVNVLISEGRLPATRLGKNGGWMILPENLELVRVRKPGKRKKEK